MTQQTKIATSGANAGGGDSSKRAARELPALLDVRGVCDLLGCSTRHIYRLADAGHMPRPVKLGALLRWSRAAVLEWIDQGCPRVISSQGGRQGAEL